MPKPAAIALELARKKASAKSQADAASELVDVTIRKNGLRMVALEAVPRSEAETYAARVNAGVVRGEEDALIAPRRGGKR